MSETTTIVLPRFAVPIGTRNATIHRQAGAVGPSSCPFAHESVKSRWVDVHTPADSDERLTEAALIGVPMAPARGVGSRKRQARRLHLFGVSKRNQLLHDRGSIASSRHSAQGNAAVRDDAYDTIFEIVSYTDQRERNSSKIGWSWVFFSKIFATPPGLSSTP